MCKALQPAHKLPGGARHALAFVVVGARAHAHVSLQGASGPCGERDVCERISTKLAEAYQEFAGPSLARQSQLLTLTHGAAQLPFANDSSEIVGFSCQDEREVCAPQPRRHNAVANVPSMAERGVCEYAYE